MVDENFLKVKTLMKKIEIVLVRPNFLHFKIIGVCNVTKSSKGWLCDATITESEYKRACYLAKKKGKEKPMRWNCSYSNKQDCIHIQAIRLFLERLGVDPRVLNLPSVSIHAELQKIQGGKTNESKI